MARKSSKKKTPIGLLLVLILVLVLIFAFFINKSKTELKPVTQATSQSTSTTSSSPTLAPTVSTTTESISETASDNSYAISASYPKISGLASASVTNAINNSIKTAVNGEISDFKTALPAASDVNPQDQSTLTLQSATEQSGNFFNVIFSVSEYDSGAAHPYSYIDTKVYNLQTGDPITLEDVFTSGSDYLAKLSTLSQAELAKTLGANSTADWIASGTTPDESNFDSFAASKNGLILYFDPYQVASYAIGVVTITIPWSDFGPILNPGFSSQ